MDAYEKLAASTSHDRFPALLLKYPLDLRTGALWRCGHCEIESSGRGVSVCDWRCYDTDNESGVILPEPSTNIRQWTQCCRQAQTTYSIAGPYRCRWI